VADAESSERFMLIERRQMVREALDELPSRCREMIEFLFLKDPPLPYAEVATRLSLAVGSIGFIRKRCLNKLKSALERLGF
jgi:RNA polymerase sigma factor (sigma-70 family)